MKIVKTAWGMDTRVVAKFKLFRKNAQEMVKGIAKIQATTQEEIGSGTMTYARDRGGTSRGESRATSFEMVWTYPTEARGGTGS
jgi:hypothetical protein